MSKPTQKPHDYVVKNFTASNDIIRHFIFSQAGTIDKAVAELVMNEVDAKATRIDIFLSRENQLTVSGNGVGFKSEDEIDELFSVFGFDHTTEKEVQRGRDFGKFGLGRAQIFAFGSCLWLSNQCEMVVDFKNGITGHDLPFLFKWHDEVQHSGCKVVVDLYSPMSSYEYTQLDRTLRHMLKFVSTAIYFNGVMINTPYQQVEWRCKEGHLVFQPSSSDSAMLNVYNKGVFVRGYNYSQFGVGGTICSTTETFALNVARNDIMVASCRLYAEMKELLKPFADRQRKKLKLSINEQQAMLSQYIRGDVDHETFMKTRLFPAAKGADRSLAGIISEFGGRLCVVQSCYSLPAGGREMLQREGGVMVITKESISALNLQCPASKQLLSESPYRKPYTQEELDGLTAQFQKVLAEGAKLSDPLRSEYYTLRIQEEFKKISFIEPLAMLERLIKEAKTSTRDPSKYSPTQKVQAKVIEGLQGRIANGLTKYLRRTEQSDLADTLMRSVRMGDSNKNNAWTDSKTYVAYNSNYVAKCMDKGFEGMLQLSRTIVHELSHTNISESDPSEQAHSNEFYRNFHDGFTVVLESGLYTWINIAVRQYWRERERAGLSNSNLSRKVSEIPLGDDENSDELAA